MLNRFHTRLDYKRLVIILAKIVELGTVEFYRYDIQIKKSKTQILSKEELSINDEEGYKIPLHIPVYLYVYGKGIVQRIITQDNIADQSTESLYPNFNEELNFMIRSDIKDNQAVISLASKSQIVGQIIDTYFKDVNFAGILFGMDAIFKSISFFEMEDSIHLLNFELLRNEDSIQIKKSDQESAGFHFAGEIYTLEDMLAVTSAIYFKYKLSSAYVQMPEGVKILTASFLQKRLLPIVLSVFLLTLLLNFFYFTKLSDEYDKKTNNIAVNTKTLTELETLKLQISEKEKFIDDNKLMSYSEYSYLVDNLSSVASEKVRIKELEIHPLKKEIKDGKEVIFLTQTIQIQGEAKSLNKYQAFLESIRQLSFVEEIRSQSYRYDIKYKVGKFNVEIYYNENVRSHAQVD